MHQDDWQCPSCFEALEDYFAFSELPYYAHGLTEFTTYELNMNDRWVYASQAQELSKSIKQPPSKYEESASYQDDRDGFVWYEDNIARFFFQAKMSPRQLTPYHSICCFDNNLSQGACKCAEPLNGSRLSEWLKDDGLSEMDFYDMDMGEFGNVDCTACDYFMTYQCIPLRNGVRYYREHVTIPEVPFVLCHHFKPDLAWFMHQNPGQMTAQDVTTQILAGFDLQSMLEARQRNDDIARGVDAAVFKDDHIIDADWNERDHDDESLPSY